MRKKIRSIGALVVLGLFAAIILSPTAVAPDAETLVTSNGNYRIDVDNNANEGDRAFQVSHDAGTELFRIQEDGKVGIGTAIPVAGLDALQDITASTGAAWGANFDSTLRAAANGDTLIGFRIANTYVDGGYTGVTHYGLIVSSGDVGIGTETPNALLDVRGDAIFNEDSGDNDFRIEGDTDANLFFADASTDRIGIGTASPQGALDVVSTTGGLIVPRMTTAQRNALTAVNGMIIYNTSTNEFNFYEAGAWVTGSGLA